MWMTFFVLVSCTIFKIVWKEAQQKVGHHWFIISYIAVYIQVLYRVTRVRRTGLTVPRGVGGSPQGSPRALAMTGRRRGQRSNLFGGARWRDGYHVCGGCEGAVGPGRAKTSLPGRKTVPGPSRGNAMGPPNPHEGEKNTVVGWGWVEGPGVCRWILPRWQARHPPAQAVMSL